MKVENRNGKMIPKAIDKWRFTSPDGTAIKQLAELYGGKAVRWQEPKANPPNQFQVITEANSIDVWLQPGSLDIVYEYWSGNTCRRRCDGYEADFYGSSRIRDDCLCNGPKAPEKDADLCKAVSRVSLILPNVRFGGMWRLEVKGRTFAHEAPGQIKLIEELQQRGMSSCKLTLTHRQKVTHEGTKQFIVPVFSVDETPVGITQGGARAGITAGTQLAIGPSYDERPFDTVDAEVVEDQY